MLIGRGREGRRVRGGKEKDVTHLDGCFEVGSVGMRIDLVEPFGGVLHPAERNEERNETSVLSVSFDAPKRRRGKGGRRTRRAS